MALSPELISQFAKLVNKDKKTKVESTVYGTIVEDGDGNKYVKIDGSDQLTPLSNNERPSLDSTTADAKVGERVTVLIKNHTATVTGNVSSPAARTADVADAKAAQILLAQQVQADQAYFKQLIADEATLGKLEAAEASIIDLIASTADIDKLLAEKITVTDLIAGKIDVSVVEATYATIKSLEATDAKIGTLNTDYAAFKSATTNKLTAYDADIQTLKTNSLTAAKADIAYAKIDFSNMIGVKINEAAIEHLFASSGMVKDITIDNGVITGELIGVTLKGDLVEAGTLKADRLVVKGENGIYYKLNIEGGAVASAEVTEEQLQNGLSGSVIIAKSITAEKVSVSDLVAFGATIGGFQITNDSIHSVTKQTVNATTRGFYADNDGQFNVGDETNFVKFFKDTDGAYKLRISADSIVLGSSKKNVEDAIEEVAESTKTNSEDLTKYIASTTKELENLQGQIDGSIMTWFYEYVPTSSNAPASEWTTTDLKNNHLGDLFYDTITGYCYRWQVQNNQYSWTRITDVDVTKALADAAAAQSTADNKRRVFVDTPKPPYDVGDLWTQGASGDLMRCQTAKTASQSYAAADWVKASKYTDDTAANAAQADANALKTRVTNAETRITQNEKDIALRATKTEVTDTLKGYYTKEESDAALTVSAESVKTEVSKTYATKQEVSDIEIGGTNLLLNSSFKEDLDKWNQAYPTNDNSILNIRETVSGIDIVSADIISPEQNSATVKLESVNLLSHPYSETSHTESGITYTVNEDGTVTANGTATVTSFFVLKNDDLVIPSGTYYISDGVDMGDNAYIRISGNPGQVHDGVFTTDGGPLGAVIRIASGVTVNNVVFKPMLNEGDTALPYTPYVDVGGATSNLIPFPYPSTTKTTNGVTWTVSEDGKISVSGTPTGYTDFSIRSLTPINGIEALSMSINGNFSNIGLYIALYDTDKNVLADIETTGAKAIRVSDYPTAVSYIVYAKRRANNVACSGYFYPMLNKGTKPYPFIPYGESRGAAVTTYGKNLWKYEDMILVLSASYITHNKIESGIRINASTAATWSAGVFKWLPISILDGRTLTISCDMTSSGSNVPCFIVGYVSADGSVRKQGSSLTSSGSVSFTVDSADAQDCECLGFWFYSNAANTSYSGYVDYTNIKVEFGSSATEYEPYTGATYFADEFGNVTITDPVSPYMTVISDSLGVSMDLSYKLISGFVTKAGKPCLNIKHREFNKTKWVQQDILSKVERDSTYIFSGWFLTENVVKGTTNNFFKVYIEGYYNKGGTQTWYGNLWSGGAIPTDTAGKWQRVTLELDASTIPETATSCLLEVYARDMTGDLYFRDLKLEKGNKATDWSPAPEDAELEIAKLESSLSTTAEGIVAQVSSSYVSKDEFGTYRESANTKVEQTAQGLKVSIDGLQETINKGEFEQVKVSGKNYVMDANGFTIGSNDENNKLNTTITEDGMTVKNDGSEVLTATSEGVEAKDLHAKTYLIIGNNSRFEDYNGNRTACFWIGS